MENLAGHVKRAVNLLIERLVWADVLCWKFQKWCKQRSRFDYEQVFKLLQTQKPEKLYFPSEITASDPKQGRKQNVSRNSRDVRRVVSVFPVNAINVTVESKSLTRYVDENLRGIHDYYTTEVTEA